MKTYQKILSFVLCVMTLFTTGCQWNRSKGDDTQNNEKVIPEYIALYELVL